MEKNVLANDIDFIFKKYGKKLKVVDNHTLRREGNISKDSAKIHAVSALVKTYINKGYNVVLDLNMTQEETCLLRKEFPSHFLAVCLHGEEISRAIHLGHKNGVEADIKINILELNAEQVLSKVLSEIYYGLLYR